MPFFHPFFTGYTDLRPAYDAMELERDPILEMLGLGSPVVARPVQRSQPAVVRPIRRQTSCMNNFANFMNELNMHDYQDDEEDDDVIYYHPFHGLVKQPSRYQLRPQSHPAPIQRRAQQVPQQQKQAPAPAPAPRPTFSVPQQQKAPAPAPQPKPQPEARTPTQNITMRAVENQNDYIVTASLPGFDRRDISLSFADPQTLVVSGKIVERKTVTPAPAAAPVVEEKKEEPEPKRRRKYQATVEDDTDEDDFSVISTPSASSRRTSTASEASSGTFSEIAEEPAKEEPKKVETQQKQEPQVEERVISEFSQKVQFPGPVDAANVVAAFNDLDKTLKVTIPKRPQFESQKINIF